MARNSGTTWFFYDNSDTFVYWRGRDDCSALITASVTLDMYPSDPACPPTKATLELIVESPAYEDFVLDTQVIRAPPYTVQSCDDADYPMRMNVALVGRMIFSVYWDEEDRDYYSFKIKVTYESEGVDGVYTPQGTASIIIGLFPCTGYQPI